MKKIIIAALAALTLTIGAAADNDLKFGSHTIIGTWTDGGGDKAKNKFNFRDNGKGNFSEYDTDYDMSYNVSPDGQTISLSIMISESKTISGTFKAISEQPNNCYLIEGAFGEKTINKGATLCKE